MPTVLLISGSLRDGSTNTAALRTARAVAPTETTVLYDGMARCPISTPTMTGRARRSTRPSPRSGPRSPPPTACVLHARIRRRAPRLVQEPARVDRRRREHLPQASRVDQRVRAGRADRRRRCPRLAAQGARLRRRRTSSRRRACGSRSLGRRRARRRDRRPRDPRAHRRGARPRKLSRPPGRPSRAGPGSPQRPGDRSLRTVPCDTSAADKTRRLLEHLRKLLADAQEARVILTESP